MIKNPTYVWVLERPYHAETPHIHFLIHLPQRSKSEFEQQAFRWLESREAFSRGRKSIKLKPIEKFKGGIVGAKRYILKGIDPNYADIFEIDHSHQGNIAGKRCGYTNNIGPSIKKELSRAGAYFYRKSLWFKN